MKKLIVYAALFSALALVVGCSNNKSYTNFDKNEKSFSDKPYTIGVGDQLQILVWRNEELSVSVPVRPDGKISAPLVGDITAAGKQVPELSGEIEKALSSFVRSPNVTVLITNANSSEFLNRVRITGAVLTPTSVAFSDGMTVLDLVLVAGGATEFASLNKAKLYRTNAAGEVKVYNVYLDDILNKGDVKSNYRLRPSDIVTVPDKVF